MIKRRILLQETATGRRFVSADPGCAKCPGACLGTGAAIKDLASDATSIDVEISASALNRLVLNLFGLPLLALILLVLGLEAVTNAYPLLQVLPLRLSILGLVGALMTWRSQAIKKLITGLTKTAKSNLLVSEQGLKQSTDVPTMAEQNVMEWLEMTVKRDPGNTTGS
ncbi:MAG: hypothetical protein ACPGXJ_09920 [Pseudomonadales bacterium]